jgi:hypothetical protein
MMNDKTKRILGIGGAVAIAVGAGGMFLSGASVGDASGIVGLAFAVAAAIAALVNGIRR